MRSLAKIELWDAEYAYIQMQVASLLFWSSHCHQMAQVAILAEVAPVLVEVHTCLGASSVVVDSLRCHFGKVGSHPFDFRKPLPGVFQLQPSHCYARETQYPTSSLLVLQLKDSWLLVVFPLLGCVKTILWPFWSYSRQDSCRTVQAVPDLLLLP